MAYTGRGSPGKVYTGSSLGNRFADVGTDSNLTNHGVVIAKGPGAFVATTPGSNGQVLVGSTGQDPVFSTLTSTGGTITFTPGAGTLNLEATSSSSFTWSDQGANFAAAIKNGYFATAALTMTLPGSPSNADEIKIISTTVGAVIVQANVGQIIRLGNVASMVTGTATSSARGDAMTLIYHSADTSWYVYGAQGNWLIA